MAAWFRFVSGTLVALLTFATTARAETRYVAKSGSDWGNQTCAEVTPCASVSWAVGLANSGDAIQIGFGTFHEAASVHVAKSLAITGAGSLWGTNVTTQGNGSVFVIAAGASVTLSQLAIFGGKAAEGGGVRNIGQLTVRSIILKGNTANHGGGIYNVGNLTLDRTTIIANSAGAGGGLTSVGDVGAQALVHETRILANSADNRLEGVGRIGGIEHSGRGPLILVRSAVAWNNDAGIASSTDAAVILQDSTISSNAGTGLFRRGGPATLTNVTIAENGLYGLDVRFATVLFRNSIVAQNARAWDEISVDCALEQSTIFADHSIFGDLSCNPSALEWGGASFIGVDPQLTGLGYHGSGFTPIHELLPGSPAIDSARDDLCWSWDQHGNPRPVDGNGDGTPRCDIGAHERTAAPAGRSSRDRR